MDLTKDVKYVKGVGPNRVLLLNKLNIYTLQDLITYYPRTYEDRGKVKSLAECIDGEEQTIEVVACSRVSEIRFSRKTMQKLVVRDDTMSAVITWFNQSYLKNKFEIGKKYRFFGKINYKYGKIEINSPVFDEIGDTNNTGKIIPIYPLTYNLSQNTLRRIMENAILEVKGKLEETLPESIIKENRLTDINSATEMIHFPKKLEDFIIARKRLVFEELFSMQLALLALKNSYLKDEKGIEYSKNVSVKDLSKEFPFELTGAQKRVLDEIEKDMESSKCMNRLLQGDVGSGKTAVAMCAAYKAVKSGYQAAIMAPTAILATQHLENFNKTLEKMNIKYLK